MLSILALESVHSIRFLYQHFLSGITKKSLNAFYHACSYAKADYSRFMNATVRTALHLISDLLKTQPVFLCIDDTIVPNLGQSLKMFPSCLIMLLTGVLPTWTDTVLLAWCSAYRSGKRIKFPGFRFRSVIVCGQSRNQNSNWLLTWSVRSCRNVRNRKMSFYFVTAGIWKSAGIPPRRISESGHNSADSVLYELLQARTGRKDRT